MGDLGGFVPSENCLDRHHNKGTLKIPQIQGALMDEWANPDPGAFVLLSALQLGF